ncbi:MAG: hypothetical protein IKV25_01545 [Clostridia bacterium]|nr:hypothetical protein [Clostridia bacterium]
MNACELTASITLIANSLAGKMTDDELTALSTMLVQLGDTLATIVTHRSICNNQNEKGNALNNSEV